MDHTPTFPLNAWYVAAWSHEVGRQELLARTICNTPIVFWRKSDNTIAALEDACWHRLLPLSLGRLDGDEVVCRYHGLAFDGDGKCARMPSQDKLNPSACVKSFPNVERHRFVWIWPGDPALADPSLVPDMHWNDDPEWEGDGQTMYAECDQVSLSAPVNPKSATMKTTGRSLKLLNLNIILLPENSELIPAKRCDRAIEAKSVPTFLCN